MDLSLCMLGPDGTPLEGGVVAAVNELLILQPSLPGLSQHWRFTPPSRKQRERRESVGSLTPDKKNSAGRYIIGSGGYGRITNKLVLEAIRQQVAEYGGGLKVVTHLFVHRYLYWAFHGDIPVDGDSRSAVLDHDGSKCLGRLHDCCNPLHLTAVTSQLNSARGNYARRHQHQTCLIDPLQFERGRY